MNNEKLDASVAGSAPTPIAVTPQQIPGAARAQSPYLVPVSIVLGAFILGVFVMIGLAQIGHTNSATSQGAAATAAVDVKNVKTDGASFIGNPKAPVTLVYWSDYQCPFCKAFEVGGVAQINNTIPPAMPEIIKNYVDTGKVRVVFKEFPFLGNDSITAANYAYAIWDLYPAQFYNWRVAMFKAQDQEGDIGFGNAKTIDALITAQFPQMDDAKIKQQIMQKQAAYTAAMNADRAEGQGFGISGTPGFITGTKLIGGDSPYATFSAAIDAQL